MLYGWLGQAFKASVNLDYIFIGFDMLNFQEGKSLELNMRIFSSTRRPQSNRTLSVIQILPL